MYDVAGVEEADAGEVAEEMAEAKPVEETEEAEEEEADEMEWTTQTRRRCVPRESQRHRTTPNSHPSWSHPAAHMHRPLIWQVEAGLQAACGP